MPEYHPNLSSEINAIIAKGADPHSTINLEEISVGSVLEIVLGEGPEAYFLKIKIVKPAKRDKNAAEGVFLQGTVIGGSLRNAWARERFSPIGRNCALIGSCTKNPYAPVGMTMLSLDNLTLGRNLLWSVSDNDGRREVLSPKPITVLHVLPPA